MPTGDHSFIDIAVLDEVRERFAAGDALVLADTGLSEIIWANGEGAALLDAPDIEAVIGTEPALGTVAKRQIKALPGYPDIGRDRSLIVRMTRGLSSHAIPFHATGITLPGGEKAILLAVKSDSGDVAERIIAGLSQPGQFVALVGAGGTVAASSPGFERIGLSAETLAGLVDQAAGQRDRLVKRMIAAGARRVPAGLARLTDTANLLIVVDESLAEAPPPEAVADSASADEPVVVPAAEPAVVADVAEAPAPAIEPEPAPAVEIAPVPEVVIARDALPAEPVAAIPAFVHMPADVDAVVEPVAETPAPVEIPAAPEPVAEAAQAAVEPPAPVQAVTPEAEAIMPAIERASAPLRFVWRTDAEGRFSALSPEFATAVGPQAADVIGHGFAEVCRIFGMDQDGEIAGLLERRDTWSGRSLLWPVAGTDLRVPVDLAALPFYGRDRSFEGFRGFGVARVGDAIIDDEATGLALVPESAAPEAQAAAPSQVSAPEPVDPFEGEPPALSIVPKPERRAADKVIRLAEHRTPANDRGLTPVERNAFREIGDRLLSPEDSAEPEAPELDPPARPAKLPERADTPPQLDIAASMARVAEALADVRRSQTDAPSAPADAAAAELPSVPAEAPEIPATQPELSAPVAEGAAVAEPTPAAAVAVSPEPETAEPAPAPSRGRHSSLLGWIEDDAVEALTDSAAEPVTLEAPEAEPVETVDGAELADMPADDEDEPLEQAPEVDSELAAYQEAAAEELAEDEPLSQVEAIAHAVKQGEPDDDADDGDEDDDLAAFGLAQRRPPVDTSILDRLPIPVLIHSGDVLHYANDEFLEFTAYDSIEALAERGGLGELFAEPYPAEGEDGDRKLRLRRGDDLEMPVEAFLQSVPWVGGKALLLSLRRISRAPLIQPAPQAAAPAPLKNEEKAALEALVTELGAIIDTATDGVILIGENGIIRSISRPAEALFGFDSADVAGKPFVSLFAIESQRTARDYLSSLSDNGVKSVLNDGREVIGREAQGRFIPLFMTIGRLPNQNGHCAVLRDITQWKRAEEDLTQARSQAERASSQKTEFLARVSHEIRTPLNAIIGFSELMMDEKFGAIGNERYRDYLRDINRSGNHVLDLVNDLLDISKIEAGQQEMTYEAVALNDTLSESVALMQPQANRERVIIRSSFASGLPDVVADLRTIRQIALNLLSNAIRYTQAGGQVIVSTAYEPTGDVVMRFRDTGIGMTPAEIEQALKPFKQINAIKRPRGDGTGLGLPLTKAMVEANRARFSINSTPGEGTLVEITFPATRVLAA
ncbi:MAG: ATP-binding protein [Rhizobiaceae bacterium]